VVSRADSPRFGGIVLCGGESRRMGRPKAWLPFGDELMLPRVVRILSGVVSPVVVVAAPGQDLPSLPESIRIVRDDERGRGPLAGLSAGLKALDGLVEAAYLSSCDSPLLRPQFVERVVSLLADHRVAVPRVGGYFHPLAAVYRLTVRPTVERSLIEGRLKLGELFDAVPTRVIGEAELADLDPDFESLRNLNTPGEYDHALAAFAAGGGGAN
jgi:molybdopterin-guanine dinucleotide biosynthesis protein A